MAGPWMKKLGKLALAILVLGSVLILVAFGLLLFLWSAQASNSTYQLVITQNELNNIVSVLAEVLKQAMSFQIGVCAAMCAAIALERFSVVLPEAASCLAMRSGDYSVWNSAFMLWKAAPRKGHVVGVKSKTIALFSLVLVIVASTIQAGSVLLISDIDLRQVPGMIHLSSVAYGFKYEDRVNGVPIDVDRRGIVTIGTWPPNSNSSSSSSITSSPMSTAPSSSSLSAPVSTIAQTIQATTGPQGVAVKPGGWVAPPSNDLSSTAPLIDRPPTWSQEPLQYPNFAEYHERPPQYQTNGIDDTGKTLRAFLPYGDANKRNTLHNFTGYTTVLDARVTCQTPNLNNLSITAMSNGFSLMLNGTVSPFHNTPRLFNDTAFYDHAIINPNEAMRTSVPAPFSCVVPNPDSWKLPKGNLYFPELQNGKSDGLLALCQLADGGEVQNSQVSGGLVSEFVAMPDPAYIPSSGAMQNYSRDTGVAYLLIKAQDLKGSYWERAWGNSSQDMANLTGQALHGQWVDVPYRDEATSIAISTTICYAAFDSANLQISASSSNGSSDRTDPVPLIDGRSNTTIVDFTPIRTQLSIPADSSTISSENRGIFRLVPRGSWLANGTQEKPPAVSYLRDQANPAGALGVGNTGNITLALWNLPPGSSADLPWARADPYHVHLFQQTLREELGGSGSPAQALQAMITVLSSMAFYNQLPQFTESADAEQTWFVSANIPVRTTGLTVVAVATVTHLIMVTIITTVFLRECKLGMLGAEWQSLFQGMRGEVAALESLDALDAMRDGEVEKLLASVGKNDVRVGIGRDKVDGRVHLMAHDVSSLEGRAGSTSTVTSSGQQEQRSRWLRWLKPGTEHQSQKGGESAPELLV